jgi:hypothetical protein
MNTWKKTLPPIHWATENRHLGCRQDDPAPQRFPAGVSTRLFTGFFTEI